MTEQPENLDNPAAPDADLDPATVETEAGRNGDPRVQPDVEEEEEGDPAAEDLGAAEDPADTDPAPLLNDDHADDFSDLEDGDDDGDDEALEGDDDE